MRRVTAAAGLIAALLAASACSASESNTKQAPHASPSQTALVRGGDPAGRTVGDTVTLSDTNGKPLQVTLTGVAYRDALAKDKTVSVPGKYAIALAFRMKSTSGGALGQQTDNMIKWQGAGAQAEEWDYTNAPWQGCIDNYFIFADVRPGKPYEAITDINTPSKGGTLVIADEFGGVARWNLPAVDTGTGTEPATRFATKDCR